MQPDPFGPRVTVEDLLTVCSEPWNITDVGGTPHQVKLVANWSGQQLLQFDGSQWWPVDPTTTCGEGHSMQPDQLPSGFTDPERPSQVQMDLDKVLSIHWSDRAKSLYLESHEGGKAYLAFHMEPGRFGAPEPEPQFNQLWDLPDDAVELWRGGSDAA